ncbi:hypothetical protein BRYFOR_09228 [Marvinbryantia formatexigens DSM 14469]|uniref:Uncharacterized protein n=2 Tax=Marvinbryantia TaxID=248744 RepID=C6LKN2_9FIRM|nr:hypothetical protein BRYFOR_09228 [Marvinbryantia formatexigens DSM 14469]
MDSVQLRFSCSEKEAEGESIEQALSEFFSNYESGIHVAVICLQTDDAVEHWLSQNEVLEDWDDGGSVAVKDPSNPTKERKFIYICVKNGTTTASELVDALKKIESICSSYLAGRECFGLVSCMAGIASAIDDIRKIFTADYAQKLSDSLTINSEDVPEIRILVFLPQECYETFKNEECYFPKQLEYVVNAATFRQVVEERNTLEKTLNEKDREIEELKEELDKKEQEIKNTNDVIMEVMNYVNNTKELLEKIERKLSSRDKEKATNIREAANGGAERQSKSKADIEKDEERHDYEPENLPKAEAREGQHYKHGERGMKGNPHEEKGSSYDSSLYRQEDDVR